MPALLPLHIAAGATALVVGLVAVGAVKGGVVHRKSGLAFVVSMAAMGLSGAMIGAFQAKEASVIGGLLATYLVLTAFTALRGSHVVRDCLLMIVGVTIAAASFIWGLDAVVAGGGRKDGIPAPIFFIFGTAATIAALGDARVTLGRNLTGTLRLRRHLWRMCFALWIAAASFFLGQADVIPLQIRIMPLLAAVAYAPLIVMTYWIFRTRVRARGGARIGGSRRPASVAMSAHE